jgi:hypothetical protein
MEGHGHAGLDGQQADAGERYARLRVDHDAFIDDVIETSTTFAVVLEGSRSIKPER